MKQTIIVCVALLSAVDNVAISASSPEVLLGQGERADWLRGSWGINWKPAKRDNGLSETLSADRFLDQIAGLRTLDYVQLHLNESYTSSPVHWGPHDLLESLWHGDTDTNGDPINLVVPRATSGVDPFLEMLKTVKAAGLKTQVYVNSSQMLERGEDHPNPTEFADITERWKAYCDTNRTVQAFINSQSYHTDGVHPERPYMFCYAEFVLKDYAIRYGDLIDGWLFDSGRWMWQHNGDNATNGVAADQRIYQAFADAVHAGNPNAAVAFNNSPGSSDGVSNPFTPATRYDDYMFGHPFQGGKRIGEHESGRYDRNYSIIQWIVAKAGNVHFDDGPWTWDDKVVGHFDPPMSTSAWNSGGVPALTDTEFLLWNREALMAGGAISWGAPLNDRNGTGENDLLIRDWAMAQLTLLDEHLSEVQLPDNPNWARAETPLPEAYIGQAYYHVLVEGVDFWDPEGDAITDVTFASAQDGLPSWLTLEEDPSNPGDWRLLGIPTDASATEYNFRLRVEDASGGHDRWILLKVTNAQILSIDFAADRSRKQF